MARTRIKRQKQEGMNLSLKYKISYSLYAFFSFVGDFQSHTSPPSNFSLSAFTSQTIISTISDSLHSPSICRCLFSPPCLAPTDCFLSHRSHRHPYSPIDGVWTAVEGGDLGQAAAGESAGGTDCLQTLPGRR